MTIKKHRRHWAVCWPDGQLLCLCVYKKGALALVAALEKT